MSETVSRSHPVYDIVGRLEEISDHDDLQLRDLVEAFGRASFVPALMVPAILVLSPLSGIPSFSTLCGACIALIALQMVWAKDHLWLPDWIMRRPVPGHKLAKGLHRLERFAAWIDARSHRRMQALVHGPGAKVVESLALLCGAVMPVMELVPFSSSILGAGVLFFCISFLARDGLWVLPGVLCMMVAISIPASMFLLVAN